MSGWLPFILWSVAMFQMGFMVAIVLLDVLPARRK